MRILVKILGTLRRCVADSCKSLETQVGCALDSVGCSESSDGRALVICDANDQHALYGWRTFNRLRDASRAGCLSWPILMQVLQCGPRRQGHPRGIVHCWRRHNSSPQSRARHHLLFLLQGGSQCRGGVRWPFGRAGHLLGFIAASAR